MGGMEVPVSASRPRRVLQRARQQDDYLHFHPEADQLQAGQLRLQTSQAPYTSKDVHEAVRALDEAPDGWRMLDWSGQGLEALAEVPASFQHVLLPTTGSTFFTEGMQVDVFPIHRRRHFELAPHGLE